MATTGAYASNPFDGATYITQGDQTRSGTPINPGLLAVGTTAGVRIDEILVNSAGVTSGATMRLWLYNGTTYYQPYPEIPIGAIAASSNSSVISASAYLATVSGSVLPIILASGWSLYATISDTQIVAPVEAASVGLTSSAAGTYYIGTPAVTAPVVTVAASAAAIAASNSTNGQLTLTSTTVTPTYPSIPTITSAGNASATSYTLIGTRKDGSTLQETVTGPNTNTVAAANVYASISEVFSSGAPGSAVTVGWSALTYFPNPTKILLTSPLGSNSGVNVTLIGANGSFVKQTEVLAGPAAGANVQSVNYYSEIFGYTLSATASNLMIGNPAIIAGVHVAAIGGSA